MFTKALPIHNNHDHPVELKRHLISESSRTIRTSVMGDRWHNSSASHRWNSPGWKHKWQDCMDKQRNEEMSDGAGSSQRGSKRAREPEHDQGADELQTWKTFSQTSSNEPLDPEGNRVTRDDVTTIPLVHDSASMINQAMWMVLEEPSWQSYNTPWLRPAARLSLELESQYQRGQGLKRCQLGHKDSKGETFITYFEHDLRNHPWVQRKFKDETWNEVVSSKEIHRFTLS